MVISKMSLLLAVRCNKLKHRNLESSDRSSDELFIDDHNITFYSLYSQLIYYNVSISTEIEIKFDLKFTQIIKTRPWWLISLGSYNSRLKGHINEGHLGRLKFILVATCRDRSRILTLKCVSLFLFHATILEPDFYLKFFRYFQII